MNAMNRTAEAALGRWQGILQSLGVEEKYLQNRHGPCPLCGGKDRYRFDDKGKGAWFCAHCGAGDGFTLLQRLFGWDFKHAAGQIDRVVGTASFREPLKERSGEDKARILREMCKGCCPVQAGDPVHRYLMRRQCLTGARLPQDVRFHPLLRHRDGGSYPAMVAILRYPDGSGAGLHRTYLTHEGQKAAVSEVKMLMPSPRGLASASVRLFPVNDTVGIAEGVETALAAAKQFDLPVWAATNAVLLQAWKPPPEVQRIVVFADHDANYAGQAAAYALAHRLSCTGCNVDVKIPDRVNSDWAD